MEDDTGNGENATIACSFQTNMLAAEKRSRQMDSTESPIVVGVFRDSALAERAVDELRYAGFRQDEIHVMRQGGSTGGIFEQLFHAFSSHESTGKSITDAFRDELPQEDADYYQREYDAGRTLVFVHSYGHQQKARDILYQFGAYNAQSYSHGIKDERVVPIREEVLQANKQPVEVGEIYIRKVVVTEEKTITVPVMREEVIIERRPAPQAPAAGQSSEPVPEQIAARVVELKVGEVLRIPVRTEQVIVQKQPVVTEEIIVGKREVQEVQQFTETVRKEVPRLEREGDVTVHGSPVEEHVDQVEQSTQTQ
jgi:uncharacterized protein (TIGR02271 family)